MLQLSQRYTDGLIDRRASYELTIAILRFALYVHRVVTVLYRKIICG